MVRKSEIVPSRKTLKFDTNAVKMVYFKIALEKIGVKKKYIGYYSLLEILDILINGNTVVKSFQRDVYPRVSEKMQVNKHTIERNIRNVISKCWSRSMMEKLGVFYPDSSKPACCEFVFLVKKYIEKSLA